jgi:predicted DNA-binding WGR domain protein
MEEKIMPKAPMVSLDVARSLFKQKKPFGVWLIQRDSSINMDKWWSITWDGKGKLCDVNHGRTGSMGRRTPFRKTVHAAFNKAQIKMSEGMTYHPKTRFTQPKAPVTAPPPIQLTGLLAEIRALYQIAANHYQAYDENGLLLMDVNAITAQRLHAFNSYQIKMTTL